MPFEELSEEDLLAQSYELDTQITALHDARQALMIEWNARAHYRGALQTFPDLEPDQALARFNAFRTLRDLPNLRQMTPEEVVAKGAELGLAPHHIANHIYLLGLSDTDAEGRPIQVPLHAGVAQLATIQLRVRPQNAGG